MTKKNTKLMLKCSSLNTFANMKLYINNLRYISEALLIHVYYMPFNERDAILTFSELDYAV